MKYSRIEEEEVLPQGNTNPVKKSIFLILFFITLTTFPLYLRQNSPPILTSSSQPSQHNNINKNKNLCNIFNGTWVPQTHNQTTYYTNETCSLIIDEQNCMKFGRPDSDYLHWRWKPENCDLARFDSDKFLNAVRNKSIAFVGDSVGKNQMYSLLCLLLHHHHHSDDDHIRDLSAEFHPNETNYFKRYYFERYNFTVASLWAPFLVKAEESDPNGYSRNSWMNLYVDEPGNGWFPEASGFDYLVVSAGQWFFRPAWIYRNRTLLGCSNCPDDASAFADQNQGHRPLPESLISGSVPNKNTTTTTPLRRFTTFEVYREAFRTVFKSVLSLPGYNGVTLLRTFSPSHFEGGPWNGGGRCNRTLPYTRGEIEVEWYINEMRRVQVEEFEAITNHHNDDKFRLMDTTEAMYMRPDGHPNFYGQSPHRNMSYADCVHWCVPGPVDFWNEVLLHLLTNP